MLIRWLDAGLADLRFALRLMRANRGFTAIAVLTLALGIGANSAICSLIDAVVLHPLSYPEPDRLFMLWTVEGKSGRGHHSSYPDFDEWRRQSRTFQRLAAFHGAGFNVSGAPGAEHVFGIECTPGLLEVLGVRPEAGRTISSTDGPRVAVITQRLAAARFGGEQAAIGRLLRLDGEEHTILGVIPRGFHFQPRLQSEPDVFVPMEAVPYRTSWFLRVVGRLRPGVMAAQAQAEMDAIGRRIVEANPELDARQGIKVDPLHRYVVQGAGTIALLLGGAAAFLLLIACANVANLLLARGAGRGRELSIRVALGASRARLVRQLLTESMLTAFAGGALGLGLAYVTLPLLAAMAPEWTPFFSRVQDNGVRLDGTVLAFTGALCLLSAIAFGIAPALKATRPVGSTAAHGRTSRSASVLVAVEVALSFVLLTGAGLMLNSLYRLLSVDPGFRTHGLQTMTVSLPEKQYPDDASRAAYVARAVDRLRALSGVDSVAVVSSPPLTGEYSTNGFRIEGPPAREGEAEFQSVSADYFRAMGIPVLRGRALAAGDRAGSPAVAVVNGAFARQYMNGEPIGRAIVVSRVVAQHTDAGMVLVNAPQRVEVVGLVGNVRQLGLDVPPRPEVLMPYGQRPVDSLTLVVRPVEGLPPRSLVRGARAELARLDPDLPLTDVLTMDEWIMKGTAPSRFVFAMVGIFAAIALMLAAFGIYGVVAHAVSRRSHEIAVRLALGARPAAVVGLVTVQHLRWLAGGVVAGAGGATACARLLERYLFGVRPIDAATYTAAGLLLLAIAFAADIVPALRIAAIQPAEVLKSE